MSVHEDQSPVPFIIVYLVLPWQTGTITMHPWIPFTGSAPSKVFFASITLSPVEPNIWTRAVIPELCVYVCVWEGVSSTYAPVNAERVPNRIWT